MTPLGPEAIEQLRVALASRVEAEAALAHAKAEEQRVVRLVHLGGASVREIAKVVGLSHQRVAQLIDAVDDGRGWKRTHKPSNSLKCSFCTKEQSEVQKLIAGPGVYICDECVSVARRGFRPREHCSFCHKKTASQLPVRGTKFVAICRECLDLCDEIISDEAAAGAGASE